MTDRELDRFCAKFKIDLDDEDACWIWTGAMHSHGYGNFWYHGESTRAHRVSYMHFVGPIPRGMVIDHLCRRRNCVNPAHMEVTTGKENILRGEGFSSRAYRKKYALGEYRVAA